MPAKFWETAPQELQDKKVKAESKALLLRRRKDGSLEGRTASQSKKDSLLRQPIGAIDDFIRAAHIKSGQKSPEEIFKKAFYGLRCFYCLDSGFHSLNVQMDLGPYSYAFPCSCRAGEFINPVGAFSSTSDLEREGLFTLTCQLEPHCNLEAKHSKCQSVNCRRFNGLVRVV